MKRAAYYLTPPLVCLAVFWRVPFIWFRIDDFAWLSMPVKIYQFHDLSLSEALFQPAAQGTIRILSERVPFLLLGQLFGITSWPFRLLTLATWFVALTLMQAIGARLTGSRNAALAATLLWSISVILVTPLAWASAYNQVLFAAVFLGAFYARLLWIESGRWRWLWIEALLFLTGFAVLEMIVVYPAVVLLHAALFGPARRHWRGSVWMLAPSAVFALAHLFVIPKNPSPIYQLIVDGRLPATLLHYLEWTVGPSQMETPAPSLQVAGQVASWIIAAALGVFAVTKLRARAVLPLFLTGWFLLLIAPVVALPNHVSDYYLTVPGMGLAWLAGWALMSAWSGEWSSGWTARAVSLALAAIYVAGSLAEIDGVTSWWLRTTSRMRITYRAAAAVEAKYPGSALLLTGVDDELFLTGFRDDPFQLAGIRQAWLAPGSDAITESTEYGDLSRFRTTPDILIELLAQDRLRVLDVSATATGGPASDVTAPYSAVLRANYRASHAGFVNVGLETYTNQLGEGWWQIEDGARWSARRASLRMRVPEGAEEIQITGFAPAAALAAGPVEVAVRVDGRPAGSFRVGAPDVRFEKTLALPPDLPSGYVTVELECSRTMQPPGDPRELGMIFQSFTVR